MAVNALPVEYDMRTPEAAALMARHKRRWLYRETHTFPNHVAGQFQFTRVIVFHRWQFTYWPGVFKVILPKWRNFTRLKEA